MVTCASSQCHAPQVTDEVVQTCDFSHEYRMTVGDRDKLGAFCLAPHQLGYSPRLAQFAKRLPCMATKRGAPARRVMLPLICDGRGQESTVRHASASTP
jgi:hypothetical protein